MRQGLAGFAVLLPLALDREQHGRARSDGRWVGIDVDAILRPPRMETAWAAATTSGFIVPV